MRRAGIWILCLIGSGGLIMVAFATFARGPHSNMPTVVEELCPDEEIIHAMSSGGADVFASTHHDALVEFLAEDYPELKPDQFSLILDRPAAVQYVLRLSGATKAAVTLEYDAAGGGWSHASSAICASLIGPPRSVPLSSNPPRDLFGDEREGP